MKDIKQNGLQQKARIRFQLGHTCGVTVFRVLEQEGIERGCGEIFVGSNGWKIKSRVTPHVYVNTKEIYLVGTREDMDTESCAHQDLNKEIYNSILETFTELGSQGNTPPKEGDRVLVKDLASNQWLERIYLMTLPFDCIYPIIVVISGHEDSYLKGHTFKTGYYKQMKPLQENTFKKISEDTSGCTFEVEFLVNDLGEDVEEEGYCERD